MHRILLLSLAAFAGNAHALDPDGTLDTSFGTGGHTKAVFTGVDALVGGALASAANRTYLIGNLPLNNSNTSLLIARLATDSGQLDATFGPDNNGLRMTDLPAGLRAPEVYGVAFQANGQPLVAGRLNDGTAVDPAFVCRLFVAGNLDTNFGTGGCRTIRTFIAGEQICRARGVAVDASANVVVSGYCEGANAFARPFVARLTSAGALDTNFAGGAGVVTPLVTALGYTAEQRFESVVVTPDGKIAVAVTAKHAAGDNDVGIVQFDAGGSFDSTFNSTGQRLFAFDLGATDNDYANDLIRRPDGRLLLVGRSRHMSLGAKITLASVLADGSDDVTFGTNSTQVDDESLFDAFNAGDWLTSRRLRAAVDDFGRIIVSAFEIGEQGDEDDIVRRFRADGSVDTHFGNGGTATIDHQIALGGPARTDEWTVGLIVRGSRVLVVSDARRSDDNVNTFVIYALTGSDIFRDGFE